MGIGSLTLRTDTSFTLGPLEGTRVSIYLSRADETMGLVQNPGFMGINAKSPMFS